MRSYIIYSYLNIGVLKGRRGYVVTTRECAVLAYSCCEGGLTVQASWLRHRIPCYGYVITESPLPGK